MAAAIPFDTLDYVRKLERAGVAAPQAEAQARALAEVLSGATVSRDDLRAVESNLEGKISAVDSRLGMVNAELGGRIDKLDGRIDKLDGRIDKLGGAIDTLKWLFGLVAVSNIAIFVRLVLQP